MRSNKPVFTCRAQQRRTAGACWAKIKVKGKKTRGEWGRGGREKEGRKSFKESQEEELAKWKTIMKREGSNRWPQRILVILSFLFFSYQLLAQFLSSLPIGVTFTTESILIPTCLFRYSSPCPVTGILTRCFALLKKVKSWAPQAGQTLRSWFRRKDRLVPAQLCFCCFLRFCCGPRLAPPLTAAALEVIRASLLSQQLGHLLLLWGMGLGWAKVVSLSPTSTSNHIYLPFMYNITVPLRGKVR